MEEEGTVFVYININMATEAKGKAKEKISLDDEQKSELIALWEGEEVLYNIVHADYHDNTKRLAAQKRIVAMMSIDITHVQVNAVMKSLRTSFLKQRRKEEDSKGTGKGRAQIYWSNWKFYDELKFLIPYTKPVATESSMSRLSDADEPIDNEDNFLDDDENEEDFERQAVDTEATEGPVAVFPVTPVIKKPEPPLKGSKSSVRKRKPNHDDMLMQVSGALAAISKRPPPTQIIHTPSHPPPPPPREDDSDALFGKTMALMAKQIKDEMAKDMAKIECQQVMLRFRANNTVRHDPYPQPSMPSFDNNSSYRSMLSSGHVSNASHSNGMSRYGTYDDTSSAADGSPSYNGSYNMDTVCQTTGQGFINIITSPVTE